MGLPKFNIHQTSERLFTLNKIADCEDQHLGRCDGQYDFYKFLDVSEDLDTSISRGDVCRPLQRTQVKVTFHPRTGGGGP